MNLVGFQHDTDLCGGSSMITKLTRVPSKSLATLLGWGKVVEPSESSVIFQNITKSYEIL